MLVFKIPEVELLGKGEEGIDSKLIADELEQAALESEKSLV